MAEVYGSTAYLNCTPLQKVDFKFGDLGRKETPRGVGNFIKNEVTGFKQTKARLIYLCEDKETFVTDEFKLLSLRLSLFQFKTSHLTSQELKWFLLSNH